jgi:hypothetical protein
MNTVPGLYKYIKIHRLNGYLLFLAVLVSRRVPQAPTLPCQACKTARVVRTCGGSACHCKPPHQGECKASRQSITLPDFSSLPALARPRTPRPCSGAMRASRRSRPLGKPRGICDVRLVHVGCLWPIRAWQHAGWALSSPWRGAVRYTRSPTAAAAVHLFTSVNPSSVLCVRCAQLRAAGAAGLHGGGGAVPGQGQPAADGRRQQEQGHVRRALASLSLRARMDLQV